jgi:hypothetical protein
MPFDGFGPFGYNEAWNWRAGRISMNAEVKSSRGRVVVLSGDPRLRGELARPALSPSWDCLRVSSPYEAAAELLVEPTGVLVVDLRMLDRRHLRLLEIARRQGTEVLGTGSLPAGASSEELSGMRLAGQSDVAAEIQRILLPRQGAEAQAAAAEEIPEGAGHEQAAAKTEQEGDVREVGRPGVAPQEGQPVADRGTSAPAAKDLLTGEELAALLGDES